MQKNKGFAAERLLRELRCAEREPTAGVCALPVHDNLFTWHGNVVLDDELFHFVVHFGDTYPLSAPRLLFMTPVPHINVQKTGALCCPLLGNAGTGDSWSPASSFYSLLASCLALQDDLLEHHNGVSRQQAKLKARAFRCTDCGHSLTNVWPAVPDKSAFRVMPPLPVVSRLAPPTRVESQAKADSDVKVLKDAASGWVEVGAKKKRVKDEEKAESEAQRKRKLEEKEAAAAAAATATAAARVSKKIQEKEEDENRLPVGYVSVSHDKNVKKRLKKKEKAAAKRALEEIELSKQASVAKVQDKALPAKKKPEPRKVDPKKAEAQAAAKLKSAMGSFAILNKDAIACIFKFLSLRDVLHVGLCCKALKQHASNTFLWRDLYARSFPETLPSGVTDFQHAYAIRVQGVVSALSCYFTQRTIEDPSVVLGYGLTYTRNPRTDQVDYVEVFYDGFLSTEAFSLGCRLGPKTGQQVMEVLPLFIQPEHFERGLSHLRKTVSRMYPSVPFEEAVVSLVCAALNTLSVLIADKGVAASLASVSAYSQLHRLFIALCAHFPEVQAVVDSKVSRFLAGRRSKKDVPSLGDFIPLMLVSRVASWPMIRRHLITEVLARNVLWAARANSRLVKLSEAIPATERLRQTWDATRVSNRLIMLSALFLSVSRRSQPLDELARGLDRLYGFPSSTMYSAIRNGVRSILSDAAFWPLYFRVTCDAKMTPAAVENLLKQAVRASRAQDYHNERTDFSRIHASGTSKILRKGESYSTGKDVNGIILTLGWGWKDVRRMLDASCLFFGNKKFLGAVDWNSRTLALTGKGVEHSGDTMNDADRVGEHRIRINLRDLPQAVDSMYLVLSAVCYCGVRGCTVQLDLSRVSNTFVSLQEEKSKANLCAYELEKAGKANCVVMAKIVRERSGWKVVALGQTSKGNSAAYEQIVQTIKQIE